MVQPGIGRLSEERKELARNNRNNCRNKEGAAKSSFLFPSCGSE
jgi:hypothetical protein